MAQIKMLLGVLVALLSLVDAAPIKIGLRKGPVRPVGAIKPLGRYGLQNSNAAETDVPITNFMDAQACARCQKLPCCQHLFRTCCASSELLMCKF